MEKTGLAYLAGILDGEGCVHIAKERGNNAPRYKLAVQVSMVDKTPPALAYSAFGGYLRLRDRNKKWKPLWEWQIKSGDAIACLKALLPYLRTKKTEAELAIKFWDEKSHTPFQRTSKQLALEETNYILMKTLKNKVRLQ